MVAGGDGMMAVNKQSLLKRIRYDDLRVCDDCLD